MSDPNHRASPPLNSAPCSAPSSSTPARSSAASSPPSCDRPRSSPRRSARPATGSSPPWSPSPSSSSQVLSDDHSCRAAVARLLAWRAARGLPPVLARHRRLLQGPAAAPRGAPAPAGPRDRRRPPGRTPPRPGCSTAAAWSSSTARRVSMPDTPENQAAYPQHSNQKPGCGFPIARIVVLLSLATGGVLDAAIGAGKGKLTGEHALLRRCTAGCRPGDILLADGYYSSFDEVVTLVGDGRRRGDAAERQPAGPTSAAARRLGREDHLVEWHRHRNRPAWMSREEFAALPRVLPMRELRVRVDKPGFRTRAVRGGHDACWTPGRSRARNWRGSTGPGGMRSWTSDRSSRRCRWTCCGARRRRWSARRSGRTCWRTT